MNPLTSWKGKTMIGVFQDYTQTWRPLLIRQDHPAMEKKNAALYILPVRQAEHGVSVRNCRVDQPYVSPSCSPSSRDFSSGPLCPNFNI